MRIHQCTVHVHVHVHVHVSWCAACLPPFQPPPYHMIADIFTKALEKGSFIKFRDTIMNHNTPLKEALSAAMCSMHGEARRLADRLHRRL